MGLWWFCFIQWPLFVLIFWTKSKHLFSCSGKFLVCDVAKYFGGYMIYLAPYLILPPVLTIILVIRTRRGNNINKLEKALAIGAWTLSLFVSTLIAARGGLHM